MPKHDGITGGFGGIGVENPAGRSPPATHRRQLSRPVSGLASGGIPRESAPSRAFARTVAPCSSVTRLPLRGQRRHCSRDSRRRTDFPFHSGRPMPAGEPEVTRRRYHRARWRSSERVAGEERPLHDRLPAARSDGIEQFLCLPQELAELQELARDATRRALEQYEPIPRNGRSISRWAPSSRARIGFLSSMWPESDPRMQ